MAETKQQVLSIPVPFEGLDTDSSPAVMAPAKARHVENFLVDRPGRLPMRGPLNTAVEFIAPGALKPVGMWVFNDKVLVGLRAESATATRDPWVAPYRKAAAAADLSTASLTLKVVDLGLGTSTDVAITAQNQAPGHSHTRAGDFVYGPSFSAATNVSVNGGFQNLNPIIRWAGATAVPVVYANAPHGAQAVRTHYRRLFVLGGRNPDGSGTIQLNTLWYSDQIGTAALPDTLAAWQDDVSGLVNQIVVDPDDNDFGVALARAGEKLVVLRRRSLFVLHGYSPSTFQMRAFSRDVGCIDPRSVVEVEDGCFFMSEHGFMYFDGEQLVNVSENLRTTLLQEALLAVGDTGQDGARVHCTRLRHGYIGVSVGVSHSRDTSAPTTTFSALFHPASRAWTYVSSGALSGGKPTGYGRTQTTTFLMDDSKVVEASAVTLPEGAAAVDRGKDTVQAVFRWVGTPTFSGGASFTLTDGAGTQMFPAGSVEYPIQPRWESRLQRLADPFNRAQLQRVILDHKWVSSGSTAWQVDVRNEADVSVGTITATPETAPTAYDQRRRFTADIFSELSELQVVVTAASGAAAPSEAELQAVHVLWLGGTHTRRSDA